MQESPSFCLFLFLSSKKRTEKGSFLRTREEKNTHLVSGRQQREKCFAKKEKKSNMNMRIGTKNLVLNPVCSYTHLAYIRAQVLKNIQWKLSFPSFPPFSKLVSLEKRSFKWNKKKRKNILFSLFKRFLDP